MTDSLYSVIFSRLVTLILQHIKQNMSKFKVGDLITIGVVRRRKLDARKLRSGLKRPPDNTYRDKTILHEGKLAIITEYHHHNAFWRGIEVSPKDNVYICYVQEESQYYILCEDEIHDTEEFYSEER